MVLFSKNLKLPLHFNLKIFHVALSHVSSLSHVLPYFPTLKQPSLCLVTLEIHISFIWSLNVEIFIAMNSINHSLYIYHLDFLLAKILLLSNSERILWSNKFFKVSPCRNSLKNKSRWPLLLMRPWALNIDYMIFPF